MRGRGGMQGEGGHDGLSVWVKSVRPQPSAVREWQAWEEPQDSMFPCNVSNRPKCA